MKNLKRPVVKSSVPMRYSVGGGPAVSREVKEMANLACKSHALHHSTSFNDTGDSLGRVKAAASAIQDAMAFEACARDEVAAIERSINILHGAEVEESNHPLCLAVEKIAADCATLQKSGYSDLTAADTSDVERELRDALSSVQDDLTTITQRNVKALPIARKAVASAVAQCRNVGAAIDMLSDLDPDPCKLLPVDIADMVRGREFGVANGDDWELFNSKERAANVLIHLIRKSLNDERKLKGKKAAKAKRDAKKQAAEAVTQEIADLMGGKQR